ncbi:MAG TPA: hypothetical protein VKW04_18775 [Planctomycetota bacterium]|nr:hypothetical protein [Planctomycetota bacterium]
MMDEQLRDNVDRLLGDKQESPSPQFEANMSVLLRSAGVPERKKLMAAPLMIAAAGFLGLIIWAARQNSPANQKTINPDSDVMNGRQAGTPEQPLVQDSQVPWRTEAIAVRDEARRDHKPCVLILGVGGGVHLVKSVEKSLLTSPRIRKLCSKVAVAATHSRQGDDPAIRELLGLGMLNPWIVVYDPNGELLGSRAAQPYSGVVYQAEEFPDVLIRMIEEILARPQSIEELERQWKSPAPSEAILVTLMERLTEMTAYGKLVEVSEGIIREEARSTHLRDLGRYYFYIGKSSGVRYEDSHTQAAVLGERLLLEMKDPAVMEKQAELLWAWGYQSEFDFPAKTREAVKRMEQEIARRPGEESSKVAIGIFSRSCAKRTETMQKELEKLPVGWDHPQAFERANYCAWLGMAKETVEYFSTHSFGSQYDRLLKEAREKLAKSQSK